MKPIYFPFTYVSDPVAEAISACFGQFVVYGPVREILPEQMQIWINRGVMDVRVPGPGNDETLKTAVKNYQIWADLHREDSIEKTAYLKTRLNSVPSLSEFSSSEIVADIKGKNHDQPITKLPDPFLHGLGRSHRTAGGLPGFLKAQVPGQLREIFQGG